MANKARREEHLCCRWLLVDSDDLLDHWDIKSELLSKVQSFKLSKVQSFTHTTTASHNSRLADPTNHRCLHVLDRTCQPGTSWHKRHAEACHCNGRATPLTSYLLATFTECTQCCCCNCCCFQTRHTLSNPPYALQCWALCLPCHDCLSACCLTPRYRKMQDPKHPLSHSCQTI